MQLKPLIVLAAVVGLGLVPTTAPAAPARNLWVSSAPIAAVDSGCAKPGYNTIQSAINAAPAAATIHICTGTLRRTARDHAARYRSLPPGRSPSSCSLAPGGFGNGMRHRPRALSAFAPDQDAIAICAAGTVNLAGLTIDAAWPANTCDDSLYGILVAGGATLNLANSSIVAAGAVPLNGCQGGVGIQVGMAWTAPLEIGHANLSGVKISGYQKNGVTVDGAGSSANIATTTVTGSGPTPYHRPERDPDLQTALSGMI